MPVGVGKQNFESWSNELDKLAIDENTIITAHSIAPVFVCKYLIENASGRHRCGQVRRGKAADEGRGSAVYLQ